MESRPAKGWKLGRDSYSKMIVWFKDGNIRTMYSLDWRHRYSPRRDRRIGLARYKNKIAAYGTAARTVAIYDTATGQLLYKYREGVAVDLNKNKDKNKDKTRHSNETD